MVTPNYNYDTEQADLLRRQKMADAMMSGALGPMQMPESRGPVMSKAHPLQAVMKIAEAYLAKKAGEGIKADQAKFTERYQNDLSQGMQKFAGKAYGQDVEVPNQGPMPDGSALPGTNTQRTPGDLKGAIAEAMASNHPVLKEFAMRQMADQQKNAMSQKDLLGLSGYTEESKRAAALANDPSLLEGNPKEQVVNGQILTRDADGNYKTAVDARDKFQTPGEVGTNPDGSPIVGQREITTGKVAFAPKGVTVNTGDTGGTAFAKELGKKRADNLQKSYDNAISANKALDAIGSAQSDLAAGIKSGAAADVGLALSKWGKVLGIEADPAITNTESFRANMARETMQLVKNLGSGTAISNADLLFAEKASGGKITLDDRAMARLMAIAKAGAANVVMDHSRLLRSNKDAGGDPGDIDTFRVPFSVHEDEHTYFDERAGKFRVHEPKANKSTAPAMPGVMSVDDYLKSKGF